MISTLAESEKLSAAAWNMFTETGEPVSYLLYKSTLTATYRKGMSYPMATQDMVDD